MQDDDAFLILDRDDCVAILLVLCFLAACFIPYL